MKPFSNRQFRVVRCVAVLLAVLGLSGPSQAAGSGPPRAEPKGEVVEVTVHDVVPLGAEGHVVMLVSSDGETVLPLAVDEYAAIAIAFRLAHLSAPRPLPADVLDSMVDKLGGQVTGVTIDDPKGEGQECQVDIRQGERSHRVVARPADGIAMALTSGTKIHATKRLLLAAGIRRSDIESGESASPGASQPKARSGKPRGRIEL